MKHLLYLFVLFIFFFSTPLAAQQVKVTASVSQQQILIGEPFQLTFRVQMPEGYALDWFKTDTFPHFEIQNRSAIDTLRNGAGQQILVQNIRLTSWDSGRWNLPAFALSGSNRTRPIPVTVSFSPMDPAQPYHEIKEVLDVERPGYQNWWWYLVGLALLLFFLLLLFPAKKKKAEEAAPAISAYREAMKNLGGLEKHSGQTGSKDFYTDLILIFRTYLMHRKDYQSPAKTTAGIQQLLPAWGIKGADAVPLSEALQLSDGVKFARFEASAAERKASLDAVRNSIVLMEKQSDDNKPKDP